MIVYDLTCDNGHGFEGWFGSSADFAAQREGGLVTCPQCHSAHVEKAPMAPAVPRKGNHAVTTVSQRPEASASDARDTPSPRRAVPPEVAGALAKLAEAQARALKNSTWVGQKFAEQSRAMHYGERDHAPIHGETSIAEARKLLEEGVAVAPLPFPIAPPDQVN